MIQSAVVGTGSISAAMQNAQKSATQLMGQ